METFMEIWKIFFGIGSKLILRALGLFSINDWSNGQSVAPTESEPTTN